MEKLTKEEMQRAEVEATEIINAAIAGNWTHRQLYAAFEARGFWADAVDQDAVEFYVGNRTHAFADADYTFYKTPAFAVIAGYAKYEMAEDDEDFDAVAETIDSQILAYHELGGYDFDPFCGSREWGLLCDLSGAIQPDWFDECEPCWLREA